ncbi:hypothetical protein LJR009_001612 [Bosea sp. LjRoot9]|uniref:hypothetical protein n=1 Tax=Bosea sp. LjRoot9 TaxID=3342341 RepID=UPI003ECEBFE1
MKLSPALSVLITEALAAGRVTRIAMGERALAPRLSPAPLPLLVNAEQCLGGRQVERAPNLDVYDAVRAS